MTLPLALDPCERANRGAGDDAGTVDRPRAHRVEGKFFAGGKWLRPVDNLRDDRRLGRGTGA